jgi:hypothetical protein
MLASGVFQRLWHWGRSGGRTPRTPHKILHICNHINQSHIVTRGANGLGHVSTLYWLQMTRVNTPLDNHHPIKYATTSSNYHVIMMVRPSTWPYGLYGQVQSASQIFACLAWRTDRDISSIRTPFAKVNIPPESGRRDGRNGTVFIAFRAL